VRVEAGRLRNKLREYYEHEGKEDPVRIELPKGSYIPAFQWRQPAIDLAGSQSPAVPISAETSQSGPVLALVKDAESSPLSSNGDVSTPKHSGIGRRIGSHPTWVLVSAGSILLLIFLAAAYHWRKQIFHRPVEANVRSIAVLPLENLSGDPQQEFFADGMTYALISDLAQIKSLTVIRWARQPSSEIAHDAECVLAGAVMQSGSRVRINAQLMEAVNNRILWSGSYQRDMVDILALQEEVTRAIAKEIAVKLTPQEEARLTKPRPVNPEAYDAYLRGRYFLEKWSDEGFEKAAEYFQQAIKLDPGSALAHAELANTYLLMAFREMVPAAVGLRKAEPMATKAVELDDTSPEAHTALANVRLGLYCDRTGAEKELKHALQLNLNSSEAHRFYADFLRTCGRDDEALAEKRQSMMLDPLSARASGSLGMFLLRLHRTDEAISQLQKTLEMDPTFALTHARLGWAYFQKGQYEQAAAEMSMANAMEPLPGRLAELANIYCDWGRTPTPSTLHWRAGNSQLTGLESTYCVKKHEAHEALVALEQMSKKRYVPPDLIAGVHARLGENEKALAWLEKASGDDRPDLSRGSFDCLRSDPRFRKLEERFKNARPCW
jgi:TolB-like protein/Tfp pilus assembly protein PilF